MVDDLADVSTDRSAGTDPDATFLAVLDHLESWNPESAHNTTAAGHLRSCLEQRLNDDESSVWDRDIVERRRGSTAADLVVNGEIGIKLVGKIGSAGPGDLSVTLRLLSERYNYLAIYWLDTSPAGADYRRNVERRISAHRSDVKGLRFVGRHSGGPDPDEPGASAVEFPRPAGAVFAGLLFVVGSGLATWLFTRTTDLVRLFLLGVAGMFVLSLVFGIFVVTR